jgi:NADH dehydrogenase
MLDSSGTRSFAIWRPRACRLQQTRRGADFCPLWFAVVGPRLLRNEISVHVIQSRSHILNTYEEALSQYAEQRFAHDSVDILTNSRVKEIQSDKILFSQKDDNGKVITKEIPMGFCLWSTGVAQTDLCKRLAAKLDGQNNKHALETDSHLRLNGSPLGDVYAIGDCATVQNNVSDHIVNFLRTTAWEKGKDPEKLHISYQDWRGIAKRVKQRFPQAANHLRRLDKLFEQYDLDKSGTLDFGELRELLHQIDSKLTSLPATAQRANQQGEYLGRKFNKIAQAAPGMALNDVDYGDLDDAVYKAFEYKHLGSLAYIGNAAIFDYNGYGLSGGLLAVYLWRGVYFAQSVSFRTRCLLAMDWTKRALFGRGMLNPDEEPGVKSIVLTRDRSDELLSDAWLASIKHSQPDFGIFLLQNLSDVVQAFWLPLIVLLVCVRIHILLPVLTALPWLSPSPSPQDTAPHTR